MRVKRVAGACVLGLALFLTGCSSPPSYDEVRAETEDAMQKIVDTLPDGTPLEDRSGEPFACDPNSGNLLSGDGQFYTGQWVLYPVGDFNGADFVDELPSKLGEEFVVDEDVIDTSFPLVRLRPADAHDVVIDVTTNSDGDDPFIGIRAISRCGVTPAR